MEAVERAEVVTASGRTRPGGRLSSASLRLLTDERLTGLAAGGNKAAFAAIYERHHQALYRYCRTITRNDEDARDALQMTMLNAMKAIDTKPRKLRAWLYRIAHNESISVLRSGKKHCSAPLDTAEPSVEAPIESRRELRELLDDIGHLSDRQRRALVMRELGGLSYGEVGDALDCSSAAAKQAAFDARTALHELAEARDTDCDSIQRRISDGDRRLLRARGVRAHLRSCDPCRRFDAAMRTRQAQLAGLVPALSPVASAAILQSVLGGAGASGVAGAATLGGGAAAIGGGAAATGGGALGGGIAMKGVFAGVAALVATGGAIAVERERSGADRGAGASVELEQGTEAGTADRASTPAAGAAPIGEEADETGAVASQGTTSGEKEHANAGEAGGAQDESGSSSTTEPEPEESATSPPAGPRPPRSGAHHPRPPGEGPIGGPRPPRPDGTAPRPPPSGEGTAPTSGAGAAAPADADGTLLPRPPRPPRGEEGTSAPMEPIRPPRTEPEPDAA